MRVVLVISGGQTGADQGGLYAAHDVGLPTGGWAPKGWKTEDGAAPGLANLFGLKESHGDYPVRTKQNVEDADFTIIVAEHMERGSAFTAQHCARKGKCCIRVVPTAGKIDVGIVRTALRVHGYKDGAALKLNVAGNRESRSPGIFVQTRRLVKRFLEEFNAP